MSKRGDETYKPKPHQIKRQIPTVTRRPPRSTRKDTDYAEVVVLTDTEEEETIEGEGDQTVREGREESLEAFTLDSVSVKSDVWSPGTFEKRTHSIVKSLTEFRDQSYSISMAKQTETSMTDLLAVMVKMQTDNQQKALEREERRLTEQARRDDQRDRETRQMIMALKDSIPAGPQTVHIQNVKLPRMTEGEDAEVFIDLFEAALTDNDIDEGKWKAKLHAALDTASKLNVRDLITDRDATYDQIKQALSGCGTLTFSASSESITMADRGQTLTLPIRQAIQKTVRLSEKMTNEAGTNAEIFQYIAIAIVSPDLKQYMDLKGHFDKENFARVLRSGRPLKSRVQSGAKELPNLTSLQGKLAKQSIPVSVITVGKRVISV